jgi:cyclic beta-1,2-glucan synthetase
MLGEGDRASRLLSLLNPIHHGASEDLVARYRVEPYVVAADVYDAPTHVGRGGWTWYTGSAAWMYRVIVEGILGIERAGDALTVNPCVAKTWSGFEVRIRDGDGEVHVVVENPNGIEHGVERVEIDGREAPGGVIPLTGAAGTREVRVVMGESPRNADTGSAAGETAQRASR